jgi:hypothetical protein
MLGNWSGISNTSETTGRSTSQVLVGGSIGGTGQILVGSDVRELVSSQVGRTSQGWWKELVRGPSQRD